MRLGDHVSRFQKRFVFDGEELEVHEILFPGFRRKLGDISKIVSGKPQRHCKRALRHRIRTVLTEHPVLPRNFFPVFGQGNLISDVIKLAEERAIFNFIAAKIVPFGQRPNGNIGVTGANFTESRVRAAVGSDQPVHTKILIARYVDRTEIPAVAEINPVGRLNPRTGKIDVQQKPLRLLRRVLSHRFGRNRTAVDSYTIDQRAGQIL